jgi:hypothetical protein
MPFIPDNSGGSATPGALTSLGAFSNTTNQTWITGQNVIFDNTTVTQGNDIDSTNIGVNGSLKLKAGKYKILAHVPVSVPSSGGGDLKLKNLTTNNYYPIDGFANGIGGAQTDDVALGGIIEILQDGQEIAIEMYSGNPNLVVGDTSRGANLSIFSLGSSTNVINQINGTPSYARLFSLGTDSVPANSNTSFQKMVGYARNTFLGLTANVSTGEITVPNNGFCEVSFMLANHDWDGDWYFEIAINDILTGHNHIFQAPASSTGGIAYANFNPLPVSAGDKISIYYKSSVGDAVDWQNRDAVSMYFEVKILAYQNTITNIINANDPNDYEYGMVETFTSSTVPALNSDYEFNTFSESQTRTIAGVSINNPNQITLSQGGMFKLTATIKPDTTASGATDYSFHDGTGFIGHIGTLTVDGGSKALDISAVAFVNTSSSAKTITLKTQAGNTGFGYDTNGTVITVQRVAG